MEAQLLRDGRYEAVDTKRPGFKPPKLNEPAGLIRSSKVTAHKAAAAKTATESRAKTKPEPPRKPAAKRAHKT